MINSGQAPCSGCHTEEIRCLASAISNAAENRRVVSVTGVPRAGAVAGDITFQNDKKLLEF